MNLREMTCPPSVTSHEPQIKSSVCLGVEHSHVQQSQFDFAADPQFFWQSSNQSTAGQGRTSEAVCPGGDDLCHTVGLPRAHGYNPNFSHTVQGHHVKLLLLVQQH